jgi:hypothetical protein
MITKPGPVTTVILTGGTSRHLTGATLDLAADCQRAAEAVAYDMADEVIGGPAGARESGTPA